jgi:NAD(P)-dependent dehydrogenase (short-subunit alcohol dehydrogenase family)
LSSAENFDQARRVSVVTGGAGGLGLGICRSLAESGCHVMIADISGERAAAASMALRDASYASTAFQCDVSSPSDVARLRDEVIGVAGKVDVLVNLAGVVRNAMLSKVTDEDFNATLDSHVVGTMTTMREFGPLMKKRGHGRIVNASSVASLGTLAGASYSAAKGAIEAMSRSIAIELAPFGVTVNCVAPGVIDAGMFLTTPKEFQEHVLSRTPMRRAGRIDEVAACVRFLASEEASFITGQTIFVCGGASIGVF